LRSKSRITFRLRFQLLAHKTYETGYPRPSGMWPRLPASGPLRSTSNRSQHSDDESIHQGVISCVPSNMDLAATRDRSTRPTIPITMRVTLRSQEPKNSCAVGFCRRNLIASTSGNLALHRALGFSGPRAGSPMDLRIPQGYPLGLHRTMDPQGSPETIYHRIAPNPRVLPEPGFGVCRECVAHTPTKPGICNTGPGGRGG
jgi:hypothetical protein